MWFFKQQFIVRIEGDITTLPIIAPCSDFIYTDSLSTESLQLWYFWCQFLITRAGSLCLQVIGRGKVSNAGSSSLRQVHLRAALFSPLLCRLFHSFLPCLPTLRPPSCPLVRCCIAPCVSCALGSWLRDEVGSYEFLQAGRFNFQLSSC